MKPCIFIFGFGYTAKALAPTLIREGFKVVGTSRMPEKYKPNSLDCSLINFDSSAIEHHLNLSTHLLVCIPPNTMDDVVLVRYGHLIKKQKPHLQWIGYLSSTGVYGNHEGNWVNEESECIAYTPAGVARLRAEQAWISFAQDHDLPLHLFRLSGIYGPGRNAIERIIQGKKQSIFKENQVFSRIHVDDICATLRSSMQLVNPLAIYNVSDNEPAPAYKVDEYAAMLLQREPPTLVPFLEAQLSPREHEFYMNNRRVSNLKIKEELNVVLQYPTYKEGLTSIWRTDYAF